MRQYWAGLALAFAACGSPSSPQTPIDGSTGSGSNHPPPCNPPGPRCPSTCGNGVVDTCYAEDADACAWAPITEACDGNSESCAAIGWLGGMATCNQACRFDMTACLGCEVTSTVLECDALANSGQLVASGSELALVGSAVTRYGRDATGALVVLGSSGGGFRSIAATPSGWIVGNSDGQLATLDANGVLGTISSGTNATAANYALGASADHALQAWEVSSTSALVVSYRIADATAAIVVQPETLGSEHTASTLRVTSDGTSFYVLALDQVARIAADGSVLATTPYPAILPAWPSLFAWGTTGGWFAGTLSSNGSCVAQRFDATGALVGTAVQLPTTVTAFGSDGDDLLAVIRTGTNPWGLHLMRITPAGTVTTAPDFGITPFASAPPQIVRFGPDLVGEWRGPGTASYLARIAF